MNSEQEKSLLDYLKQLGFEGEKLQIQIQGNIERNLPGFFVKHTIHYGEETMFFSLQFERDHQFKAYRLAGYKATHRNPIVIEHKVINGIDTAQLEKPSGPLPERIRIKNIRE